MAKIAAVRVKCNLCDKFITKGNIARHKNLHGLQPCERCQHKVTVKPICTDKTVDYWFQSFQNDLLCTEVINCMIHMFDSRGRMESEEELWFQFKSSLYHLEYYHVIREVTLMYHLFELIKLRLNH